MKGLKVCVETEGTSCGHGVIVIECPQLAALVKLLDYLWRGPRRYSSADEIFFGDGSGDNSATALNDLYRVPIPVWNGFQCSDPGWNEYLLPRIMRCIISLIRTRWSCWTFGLFCYRSLVDCLVTVEMNPNDTFGLF